MYVGGQDQSQAGDILGVAGNLQEYPRGPFGV